MFPRKKSILTTEGFCTSYVDLKDALRHLNITPGGSSGSDSAVSADNVTGLGEYVEDTINKHGMPISDHTELSIIPHPTDQTLTAVLANRFMLSPNIYYKLGELPMSQNDIDVPDDIQNMENYGGIIASNAIEFCLKNYSTTNTFQSQPTHAMEYWVEFIAKADIGSFMFYPDYSFAYFHVIYVNMENSQLDAGNTYLLHIVGNTIFLYQVPTSNNSEGR